MIRSDYHWISVLKVLKVVFLNCLFNEVNFVILESGGDCKQQHNANKDFKKV